MNDTLKKPFWAGANQGIVGLAAGPWDAREGLHWPTEGYDSALVSYDWDHEAGSFGWTGQTREEWLALADEMIARWTAWRAHVVTLPPETPHG